MGVKDMAIVTISFTGLAQDEIDYIKKVYAVSVGKEYADVTEADVASVFELCIKRAARKEAVEDLSKIDRENLLENWNTTCSNLAIT